MKNLGKNLAYLQKSNILIIALSICLSGCVTSKYFASKQKASGTDIKVTPDRIIVECEFITDYEGDRSEPYGFMIHVLDNEKTVLTLSSATVLEKRDCVDWLKQSEKIIQKAQLVTVRGRGDAQAPVVAEKYKHTFKHHGTYLGNGRSLNFLAIWNDKGQCLDIFNRSKEDQCSREK